MGERGFTLIELMVVVAILAIVAAIAFPSYQDWRNRDALASDIMKLKSALGTARSRSVQEGVYWGKVADPTDPSVTCNRLYFGVYASPGKSELGLVYLCDQDGDPSVIQVGPDSDSEVKTWETLELESNVAVGSSSTLDGDIIWFDKSGTVWGQTGTVWLTAGDKSRRVVIGNNGRIREP